MVNPCGIEFLYTIPKGGWERRERRGLQAVEDNLRSRWSVCSEDAQPCPLLSLHQSQDTWVGCPRTGASVKVSPGFVRHTGAWRVSVMGGSAYVGPGEAREFRTVLDRVWDSLVPRPNLWAQLLLIPSLPPPSWQGWKAHFMCLTSESTCLE